MAVPLPVAMTAAIFGVGSAATIPHPIVRAIPAEAIASVPATAGVAATTAVVTAAIDDMRLAIGNPA